MPPWLDIWLTASTAWVRELTPSARSTAATWSFTVSTERLSSRAISLFDWPRSSRPSTSVWRGVSLNAASAARGAAAGCARALALRRGALGVAAHRHRRHVDAAAHDDVQRFLQRLVAGPLRHEAHGAEVDGADHVGAAIRRRDHHHRHGRIGVAQLGQHLEAVGIAEAQVEQHQVEVRIGGERLARGACAGDADHGDVAADPLDDVLQRREDQRMVVDEQDFHRDLDLHV